MTSTPATSVAPIRRLDETQEPLQPLEFQELASSPPAGRKAALELLNDIDLNIRIELGRTQMYLEDVLKLRSGSVVTLDKLAGDPVDVLANGRIVARGRGRRAQQ